MDSFTQLVLGAAVGGATLGGRAGRKAILWGGLCGTLPDLDVLIRLGDPVSDFTYHRGVSHALFFLTLAAPAVALLIWRLHGNLHAHYRQVLWMVWLCLVTHPLLDCFTVYGTQILLPFSDYPVGWSTIFIIDPVYTLPLVVGTVAGWTALGNRPQRAYRRCLAGLMISSAYLMLTVAAKLSVDSTTRATLSQTDDAGAPFLTGPTPFNTFLLWRILVVQPNGYLEGFYSLLDRSDKIEFASYPSQPALLDDIDDEWAVQRLRWFTKGFYRVRENNEIVTLTDLRLGMEPYYVFSFHVGKRAGPRTIPISPQRAPSEQASFDSLVWIWNRITGAAKIPASH